jgi:hypothetical protein
MKERIESHYEGSRLILEEATEKTIEHNHFEILRRSRLAGSKIRIANWSILWKSPPRPQNLMAVLRELSRRVQQERDPRPEYVTFHIYRSLSDIRSNLSVARVEWVDPLGARADYVIKVIGAPGHFKMRYDTGVDETREYLRTLTTNPDEFESFAIEVGSTFDQLTEVILANPTPTVWNDELRALFDATTDRYNKGPFAPTEMHALERVLQSYDATLLEHEYVSVYRSEALGPATTARLLAQTTLKLRHCYGAWRLFLRSY